VEEQKLVASDAAADDLFGFSVSVSGPVVAVGAPYDLGGGAAGLAYVFRRGVMGWTEEQELTASDRAPTDLFGWSVSVSGDIALIGAPMDDHAAGDDAGSAYVFRHDSSAWKQTQMLTASEAAPGDQFGNSVSLSGRAALIGAPYDQHAGGVYAGSAYRFREDGSIWTEVERITGSDTASFDFFGFSVAIKEDRAVVGALGNEQAGRDAGSAYVFDMPIASWASYGSGWPGTHGIPDFTAATDPALCATVTLNLGNSLGTSSAAVLLLGVRPADQPTPFDGHLLVVPASISSLPLPGSGTTLTGVLPCNPWLCDLSLFLQVIEVDPGASRGRSFTRGLWLHLGS
jgi:hypothetical protein